MLRSRPPPGIGGAPAGGLIIPGIGTGGALLGAGRAADEDDDFSINGADLSFVTVFFNRAPLLISVRSADCHFSETLNPYSHTPTRSFDGGGLIGGFPLPGGGGGGGGGPPNRGMGGGGGGGGGPAMVIPRIDLTLYRLNFYLTTG